MTSPPATSPPPPTEGGRVQRKLAELVGRRSFWLFVLALSFAYIPLHVLTHPLPDPIPVLGTVGPFELIDQDGEPYGSKQLLGRLWIAVPHCTACPDADPERDRRLFEIQHRSRNVGEYFRIVTLSVDPERDTPEALLTFQRGLRASERMWSSLTGSPEAIRAVVQSIYEPQIDERGDPGHLRASERLRRGLVAMVDPGLHIRRYYDIRDDAALDGLLRDMGLVLNRGY